MQARRLGATVWTGIDSSTLLVLQDIPEFGADPLGLRR